MPKGDGSHLPRTARFGGSDLMALHLEAGHLHVIAPQLCLAKMGKYRPWRVYRQCRWSRPLGNDAQFTGSTLDEIARWIKRNYPTNNGEENAT